MFGHPKGLRTLFFTEFWERFSFYGIRAILVLYMTAGTDVGGLRALRDRSASITVRSRPSATAGPPTVKTPATAKPGPPDGPRG